ncbi:MAG: hypothetical protein ACXWJM_14910 [Ramlibacter sp.]
MIEIARASSNVLSKAIHEPLADARTPRAPDAIGGGTPALHIAAPTGGQDDVSTQRLQGAAEADARTIAAQAVAAWTGIDAALSPVVGRRGVAALYKRSLHLTTAAHPWLASACQGASEPGDYSALLQAIELQTSVEAAASHGAVLKKFREMLAHLIGESLTERLLQPVWTQVANGQDAQDKS